MVATLPPRPGVVRYAPLGEARTLFECRDPELLIEGPAGTGKSYACLWKMHLAALKYPGMRGLMLRKVGVTLTSSALVTFQERVLGAGNFGVRFYGGSKAKAAAYLYPNGSIIAVGGLDKATKIMSAEYDLAYTNEATELTENDWESITSRLRYGVMPYQQLIADCNPEAPSHWLNQRCENGLTTRLRSRHEDNPVLWNQRLGDWTQAGRDYVIGKLDRLTGVRYKRLRLGQWVAAEGQVYDAWDPAVHIVKRADVADLLRNAWYIGAVDWGWTNPGTLQVWAVDRDGRLLLVAEHYHTRKPVDSWWIPRALQLDQQYQVQQWVCDPAEPAYIAQFQAAGLNAIGAKNDIMPGITAMQDRLIVQGNGRPRLLVLDDALRERDELLAEADSKPPVCLTQELPLYVWAKNAGGETLKDRPVDAFNHAMDTARYAVAALDLGAGGPSARELAAGFRDLPGL